METLKNYLLAITAAAIICAIARSLCEEKTVSGSMIRLIAGIVMTVTVLSPVVKLKFDDLPDLSADFTAEAASAAAARKEMAEAIGKTVKTVQRIINENNNVKFVGSSKSGHWEIIE